MLSLLPLIFFVAAATAASVNGGVLVARVSCQNNKEFGSGIATYYTCDECLPEPGSSDSMRMDCTANTLTFYSDDACSSVDRTYATDTCIDSSGNADVNGTRLVVLPLGQTSASTRLASSASILVMAFMLIAWNQHQL